MPNHLQGIPRQQKIAMETGCATKGSAGGDQMICKSHKHEEKSSYLLQIAQTT